MSSWTTSWQCLFAHSLLKEIFNPFQSPLLSLPPELLQRIAIVAFPGDPYDNFNTLRAIVDFLRFARVSSALGDALLRDGFCERHLCFLLCTRLGIGRPLDLKGYSWRKIAVRLITDMVKKDEDYSHLDRGSKVKDAHKGFPNPKIYESKTRNRYSEKQIGPLIETWEPLIFDKVLNESEVQGKLISAHNPHHSIPRPLILPLSSRAPTYPPTPLHPYPTPKDISIGMTFATAPAMTKITIYVELGNLYLGEVGVQNGEGVCLRDVDCKLAEFLNQPFTPSLQTELIKYVPTACDFHPDLTIRDVIAEFGDSNPTFLPCVLSGKTAIGYLPAKDKEGRMIMRINGQSLWDLFGED